jgi:5-methyltetrahydrofolate--homocysteine methyltransferase
VLGLAQGAEPGDIIVAKSNCGLPVMGDDMKVRYNGTPEIMAAYARMARDAGARIIGGCCGTTPTHVRAMVQAVRESSRQAPPTYEEIERLVGTIRKRTVDGEAAPRRRAPRATPAAGASSD